MRKPSSYALILGVVAVLCFAGWTSRANPSAKTVWEYKVISTYAFSEGTPAPNIAQLDDAGAEGWELIAVRSGEVSRTGARQVRTDYFLKRVK